MPFSLNRRKMPMRSSLFTDPMPFCGSFIQTSTARFRALSPKPVSEQDRFGFLQDSPGGRCGFKHQIHGLLHIGGVRNSHWGLHSDEIAAVGPIDHLTSDQTLIRYKMFDAAARNYGDITAAQEVDPAVCVSQLNHVAGLDRLISQDHETTDQIGEYLLQAEADPKPQSPAE